VPILISVLRLAKARSTEGYPALDPRRILRLLLLVVTSIVFVVVAACSSNPDAYSISISSWCISNSLDVYVAIDLYTIDMRLMQGGTGTSVHYVGGSQRGGHAGTATGGEGMKNSSMKSIPRVNTSRKLASALNVAV